MRSNTLKRRTRAETRIESGEEPRPRDWQRLRLSLSIGVFGGVLGGAVILVNLLTRFELPHINIPEHPPFSDALVLSFPGFIAGLLITGPVAYWLFGPPSVLHPTRLRPSHNFAMWFGVGFVYSLVLSSILGGLFLPFSFLFREFLRGTVSVPGLLNEWVDLGIAWPFQALVLGVQLMFTSMFAGGIFGVGAWVIDRFNASRNASTAKYGTIVMAVILSIIVAVLVAVVPETTLVRLG